MHNDTTKPGREITLVDVWEALGSLAVRVGQLADAVEHLAEEVAALHENERHFEDRVRNVRAN